MEQEKLNEIIENHVKWLQGDGGKRANLAAADLYGADLEGVNLRRANLCSANLRRASLRRACLCGADLEGADLEKANLKGANLCEADLEITNLEGANLEGADLRGANLEGADLRGASLCRASLEGANLPTDMYQVVGAGSCNRCTTYDATNNQVICGCWSDGAGNKLNSFARRIEEIYGTKGKTPTPKYYTEYMSVINFFRAMKELK